MAFSIWKSSLAGVQFSSTPNTELQGIYYTTWWTKASPYTFFWGTSIFSHPLDRRKQRKVTGADKLMSAILKNDVVREREWLLKHFRFNNLSSPLPQLLSHNCPVYGAWASWKSKGERERDNHTLCQHLWRGTLLLIEPAQSKYRFLESTVRKKIMVCSAALGQTNPYMQARLH